MTPEAIQKAIETLDNLVNTSQNQEAKAFAYELLKEQAIKEVAVSFAKVYNILGNVYRKLSDYPKALEYYSKALHINEEIGNKVGIAINLANIGYIYRELSDNPKAIEYYSKSLHINEEIGRKVGVANNLGNIGVVYKILSDYHKALEYYGKALVILEEIGDKSGIASNLGNIGNVYRLLSNYPKALEYHSKALLIFEENGNKERFARNLGNIGGVYMNLSDYTKALEYSSKALFIHEEIGNKVSIAINLGNIGEVYATKESTYYDAKKAEEYLRKSLQLAEEIGAKNIIKSIYENLHTLRRNEKQYEEALEYYKKSVEIDKEIQSEETKKNAQIFDQRRKLEEDEKVRQLKLARFQEQEKILNNILPVKIADRILKQETFIADHFESVSVLFMDLVGFTSLSSIAPPKQLVYLLDAIFQNADDVLELFGLEKIKTIGDGYLAVGNVTKPLENHQKATAQAALQLLETMKDFVVNIPSDFGNTDWTKDMNDIEIRIGIHTGEVVAGIIGKNKYTYDLWGDAVNVASRMESNSEAGRIHISEQFAKSIESNTEFNLIPRGTITIKGKGTMNTFWLEKAK
jgi:class 3 adenylate cyclase/TPR repeat protein